MRTDELIALLATQTPPPRGVYLRRVALTLLALVAVAVAVVAATLGLRADLVDLFANGNRAFKYAFTTTLLLASGLAWWRDGKGARGGTGPLMFVLLVCGWLLILSVKSAFLTDPAVLKATLFNRTAFYCVGVTSALALGASLILARLGRAMMPQDARTHGYLGALFAISIGLFAYALHCPADEPLYIATWYGLAVTAFTAAAGPVLARRAVW